uniref:Uncharacterized protein n=1 Tax=Anguilla anguilla TaxID=7936 RepID=A0A0E9RXK0_ANGAN
MFINAKGVFENILHEHERHLMFCIAVQTKATPRL